MFLISELSIMLNGILSCTGESVSLFLHQLSNVESGNAVFVFFFFFS